MKPETQQERFYKRLGGLTATLPQGTREFKRAREIVVHTSILRARERALNKESSIDRLFRNRLSGHWSWWDEISKKLTY